MLNTNPPLDGLAMRFDRGLAAVMACVVVMVASTDAHGQAGAQGESPVQEIATKQLAVPLGQAEVLRYSREPGTVIVGDSTIAAASIATSDILVLTGLRPGETNVIVLDDAGGQIDRMTLRVIERGDTVVVRRNRDREVLRCTPLCAPTDSAGVGFALSETVRPEASESSGPEDRVGPAAPAGL